MRYFQEIDLAEFCPISEAADWLAFGLLPAANYCLDKDDRPIEERLSVDDILENMGHRFGHDLYLGESYLRTVFPDVDAAAYLSAFDECDGSTPEAVQKNLSDSEERFRITLERLGDAGNIDCLKQMYQEQIKTYEAELLAAKRLRQLQVPIMHRLHAARAKLFMGLISGKVEAKGVVIPRDDKILENWEPSDWPIDFSSVPETAWDMQSIDWHGSNLELWDRRYLGVVVPTAELLRRFPVPDLPMAQIEVSTFGNAIILESSKIETPAGLSIDTRSRRRGAPHSTERILEAAIHKHLENMNDKGTLPRKREAVVAEVSDFVLRALGEQIKRTTAQRIIQRWTPRSPAHKS